MINYINGPIGSWLRYSLHKTKKLVALQAETVGFSHELKKLTLDDEFDNHEINESLKNSC